MQHDVGIPRRGFGAPVLTWAFTVPNVRPEARVLGCRGRSTVDSSPQPLPSRGGPGAQGMSMWLRLVEPLRPWGASSRAPPRPKERSTTTPVGSEPSASCEQQFQPRSSPGPGDPAPLATSQGSGTSPERKPGGSVDQDPPADARKAEAGGATAGGRQDTVSRNVVCTAVPLQPGLLASEGCSGCPGCPSSLRTGAWAPGGYGGTASLGAGRLRESSGFMLVSL